MAQSLATNPAGESMNNKPAVESKRHFWMAMVNLTAVRMDNPEQPFPTQEQVVHATKEPFLSRADLVKMQEHAQISLHKKVEGVEVQVLELIFANISNLGCMTDTEFYGAEAVAAAKAAKK
jgi:hypothetical protein